MIILNDLNILTRSDKPNEDWTDGEARYVVEDGSELAIKIMECAPYFEPIEKKGVLIDIKPKSPPIDLFELRKTKLAEISNATQNVIFSGIDVPTSQGVEHFSLTMEDQKNILAQMGYAEKNIPVLYHADGKQCRIYAADEFMGIAQMAFVHITYHTTLCNMYNTWIRESNDAEEIQSILYGIRLPQDLEDAFNDLMDEVGITVRAPESE